MYPSTLEVPDQCVQESVIDSDSDFLGELQPSDSASHDPADECRANAQSGSGAAQTAPSKTSKTFKKAPPSLEPGWQTVRKESVVAGRALIYSHACLDDECEMDLEWREELLYQHLEFWTSIHESPQIVGNSKLAKKLNTRLAKSNARRNLN